MQLTSKHDNVLIYALNIRIQVNRPNWANWIQMFHTEKLIEKMYWPLDASKCVFAFIGFLAISVGALLRHFFRNSCIELHWTGLHCIYSRGLTTQVAKVQKRRKQRRSLNSCHLLEYYAFNWELKEKIWIL